MSEIAEVQVINPAGIPVYYHNNSGSGQYDDTGMILQSSFITAISQFAQELQNGEVKLIQFEFKKYLLARGDNFDLIFTTTENETDLVTNYQSKISEIKEYLDDQLLKLNLDFSNPNSSSIDQILGEFDGYLRKEKLVEGGEYDRGSFTTDVRSLIFKSVGYEPGKCNIGRAERMRRLNYGLVSFVISALLFASIVLFDLPDLLILGLIIPNFMGFLGFLQYFYRFCTTNAMTARYQMV